jgi:hypothetical protein
MCGGPKFSPPPPDPVAEAEKAARTQQIETQRQEAQEERSRDKGMRLQENVARSAGMYGFRSLISGRRGGSGFGRELLG